MFKQTLVSVAIVLAALSGISTHASAAQAQPAATAESNVTDTAYTAQLAARSNATDGGLAHTAPAAKALAPIGNGSAGRNVPADPQCVGPVSFCTPYFGS
ncbi:hypothetical protein AB1286_19115 [Trinickia sp. NRRL B-1857]|uniref:hypothetical protein n=1 Tax=Trinickia sp. NRRL B-1857 TaxID=3162879 RepID=UPI003D2D9DE5